MRFPYRGYEVEPAFPSLSNGSEELFRPEVPLRVRGPLGDSFILGLLDTGADEVLFPYSIAEAIGIDLTNARTRRLSGIGGQTIEFASAVVDFEITDGDEVFQWSASAGLAKTTEYEGDQVPVFGNRGFLEFFNAEFRGGDHEVVLTPIASSKP